MSVDPSFKLKPVCVVMFLHGLQTLINQFLPMVPRGGTMGPQMVRWTFSPSPPQSTATTVATTAATIAATTTGAAVSTFLLSS